MRVLSTVGAALLSIMALMSAAHTREFSPQQEEALGRAAGYYVGGAYFIELGTDGDCAGVVPKPTSHLQSVKALLAKAPASVKAELQGAFGKGAPDHIRRAGVDVSKRLFDLARQTGAGKQFFCGALFGLGAAEKMRGIQEWLTLTGVSLPLVE